MGHHEEMDTFFEVKSHRDFYLWGLYPIDHTILLDEELASLGATEAVVIKFGIDNSKYWSSFFYQLFTFGMYRPEYFYIKAKGRKSSE